MPIIRGIDMITKNLAAGFCLALGVNVMLAGCSEQGAGNIPEEKVITKESSEDMMKKLEEGRKSMNQSARKK
jgi:hypothetical protein